MQSARVWQTQEVKGGVAPPEELPSINYDSVRTSMRKMGSAPTQRRTGIDPAGIGNLVREAMAPVQKEFQPNASQWLSGGAPKRHLKFASDEAPVDTGVCSQCNIPHPCHHDVKAASDAGDMKAVQAMNEVRNMRRVAFVQAQEQAVEAANKAAFVKEASARQERRTVVSEILDQMESELSAPKVVVAKDKKTSGFKSIASMSPKEKEHLVKWSQKNGWDPGYAEKFFAPVDDGIPEAIKKVAMTSLDEASKKSIITSMMKEAKLTEEQKNRIADYWKNELQYQDTDWIGDLVSEPDK